MKLLLLIFSILCQVTAWADTRSAPGIFWATADGGAALGTGYNRGESGANGSAALHVEFDPLGIMFRCETAALNIKWHEDVLEGSSKMNACGIGLTGKFDLFKGSRTFGGSFVMAHLLVERAWFKYDIGFSGQVHERASENALGGSWGAEFYFPLWLGFWVQAGINIERFRLKYKFHGYENYADFMFQPHVGLSYSF